MNCPQFLMEFLCAKEIMLSRNTACGNSIYLSFSVQLELNFIPPPQSKLVEYRQEKCVPIKLSSAKLMVSNTFHFQ